MGACQRLRHLWCCKNLQDARKVLKCRIPIALTTCLLKASHIKASPLPGRHGSMTDMDTPSVTLAAVLRTLHVQNDKCQPLDRPGQSQALQQYPYANFSDSVCFESSQLSIARRRNLDMKNGPRASDFVNCKMKSKQAFLLLHSGSGPTTGDLE